MGYHVVRRYQAVHVWLTQTAGPHGSSLRHQSLRTARPGCSAGRRPRAHQAIHRHGLICCLAATSTKRLVRASFILKGVSGESGDPSAVVNVKLPECSPKDVLTLGTRAHSTSCTSAECAKMSQCGKSGKCAQIRTPGYSPTGGPHGP